MFWGTWGAVLPAVQQRAGADDGQLGLSLLLIGVGALPALGLAGLLLDRTGPKLVPLGAVLFALAGIVPGLAYSVAVLAGGLVVLGIASGGFDVALNTAGVDEEGRTGRPLLQLAHAGFSGGVVMASVLTGQARGAGAEPASVLAVAGGVVAVVGLLAPARPGRDRPCLQRGPARRPRGGRPRVRLARPRRPAPVLAVLGALTALAFAVENAQQSWSAVHLERTLGAGPEVSALAPALFAAATLASRLAAAAAGPALGDRLLVGVGALVAAGGTVLAALAGSVAAGLAGVAITGAGTGVCAPVLLSLAGRRTAAAERGRAVGTVQTLAYLGFLVGPAYLGLIASAAGLRSAFVAVAALALILAATAWRARATAPLASA